VYRLDRDPSTNATTLAIYHTDHLGTPQMMTSTSGAVLWSQRQKAFGEMVVDGSSTIVNNLRFPGQYFDAETLTHYNYFRDYDPSMGRYVQADPVRLFGGANLYAYVGGNPLSFVDPVGLMQCRWVGLVLICETAPPLPLDPDSPETYPPSNGPVIPFPGRKPEPTPVPTPRPGAGSEPRQCPDEECTFTGLATYTQTAPYSYELECQYRCPRKGLKYYVTVTGFPSLNPRFLCPASLPESVFSWSGRY
jgi:RHS repeat-associated protein